MFAFLFIFMHLKLWITNGNLKQKNTFIRRRQSDIHSSTPKRRTARISRIRGASEHPVGNYTNLYMFVLLRAYLIFILNSTCLYTYIHLYIFIMCTHITNVHLIPSEYSIYDVWYLWRVTWYKRLTQIWVV